MKLKACSGCGLVFDLHFVTFPTDEEMWDAAERGEMHKFSEWDGDRFIPIVKCPVCDGTIRSEI